MMSINKTTGGRLAFQPGTRQSGAFGSGNGGGRGGSAQAASGDGGMEDFITKEEVARRLKKTTRTIENWQRRGYIPFVKVQQSVLFRWSSVVAELERRFGVGSAGNN